VYLSYKVNYIYLLALIVLAYKYFKHLCKYIYILTFGGFRLFILDARKLA